MAKAIKILLAILFFICMADMPYGFYQIVRFVALLGFSVLAYNASGFKNKTEMIIYICLAILFQPFVKISLGKEIWKVVDAVVGAGLLISIFIKSKASYEK